MDRGELKDKKAFVELVREEFSSSVGEKVMTISEQFREEGRREGIEKGKIEVAKQLLAEKAELTFIQRITGLSLEKFKHYKM